VTSERRKKKGRRSVAPFLMVPLHVLQAPEMHALTAVEFRVLMAIAAQARGHFNGRLLATPAELAKYGLRSRRAIDEAVARLLALGFIVQTRIGRRGRAGKAALFAVTWDRVELNDDMDVPALRDKALNLWRREHAEKRAGFCLVPSKPKARGRSAFTRDGEIKPPTLGHSNAPRGGELPDEFAPRGGELSSETRIPSSGNSPQRGGSLEVCHAQLRSEDAAPSRAARPRGVRIPAEPALIEPEEAAMPAPAPPARPNLLDRVNELRQKAQAAGRIEDARVPQEADPDFIGPPCPAWIREAQHIAAERAS
jgi:hypothetical protein